jgi:methylthioribose-1-phosphate isomerase
VLPDAAAASLFSAGLVDLVIVGADRVCADGSVANKVGTYGLAILAQAHDVPFVVVAPSTTVDLGTPSGADVEIEQRSADEVTSFAGRVVAPPDTTAYNPAFDVTPARLVTALVTEHGVLRAPDAHALRALGRAQ